MFTKLASISSLGFILAFTTSGCLAPQSTGDSAGADSNSLTTPSTETVPGSLPGGGGSGGSGSGSSNTVTDNTVTFKTLGSVVATRSNYACTTGGVPYKCYDLTVTCPGVQENAAVVLYTLPPVGTDKGTITFHSGAKGTGFWTGASTYAYDTFSNLNAQGFRTIQVKWSSGWLDAAASSDEGAVKLSCRPATVIKWVYDNLRTSNTAFCATGNSGGSVQISYAVSHYGLSNQLDAVAASSGPGTGRLDTGCLDAASPLYLIGQQNIFDGSYGFTSRTGPCTQKNSTYTSKFEEDSIGLGDWDYFYPKTMFWQVVGALDTDTATINQSEVFYQRLVDAGSPLIHRETLANSPHTIPETQEGATKIFNILNDECKLRH